MDNINTDTNFKSTANFAAPGSNYSDTKHSPINPQKSAQNSNILADLTDISNLANQVENSSPDIRQEFIDRAKALIEDPNWLNDSNLSKLASKISQEEII